MIALYVILSHFLFYYVQCVHDSVLLSFHITSVSSTRVPRAIIRLNRSYPLFTIYNGSIDKSCISCPSYREIQHELSFISSHVDYFAYLHKIYGKNILNLYYDFLLSLDDPSYRIELYTSNCYLSYSSYSNGSAISRSDNVACVSENLFKASNLSILFMKSAWDRLHFWKNVDKTQRELNDVREVVVSFWYTLKDGENVTTCSLTTRSRTRNNSVMIVTGDMFVAGEVFDSHDEVTIEATTSTVPNVKCEVSAIGMWYVVLQQPTSMKISRFLVDYTENVRVRETHNHRRKGVREFLSYVNLNKLHYINGILANLFLVNINLFFPVLSAITLLVTLFMGLCEFSVKIVVLHLPLYKYT
ncbi:a155.1 [Rat cytomegalovirus ALL-03]|uniref:A155.1 n=2 Tax=Rat cytomegalovirus (isolate England) TaxID=1261657 RepID=A0A0F6TG86_RCMVE|nr:e155.1 [Murid betaherpesvirus 8]AKE44307.1 a155.1 [Rat cytomegalovirus ALL-03]AFX83457.1 e155.1 [Murid betaherpesvirus 8]WEG71930.1 membrane protein e154 [Murid betaherpesvirus 8]WPH25320.1 membrane protein e154 [Murid betaherpesvirus 8]WPH25453.1 membrane protein e154 [Murid betaherpesvirus 8]